MRYPQFVFIIISILLSNSVIATKLGTTVIQICNADADWPPYYFVEQIGDVRGFNVLGYDQDVLTEIYREHGISVDWQLLAWTTCLEKVKAGTMHAVTSISKTAEREQDLLFSAPYYELTPTYTYDRTRFPRRVRITRSSALPRLGPVCGIKGYNYDNYGIRAEQIRTKGIKNYYDLLEALRQGDCAFVLARYEIMAGFGYLNKPLVMKNFTVEFAPDVAKEPFYVAFSKQNPEALILQVLFNQGLNQLKAEKKLNAILNKYIPKR